ncbi:hypothetical protein SOHN41_02065 [Shewanella sp. HN-41]|nr:hypothetical protein SOHN41_02065 [Shewanella sp. HN-41]
MLHFDVATQQAGVNLSAVLPTEQMTNAKTNAMTNAKTSAMTKR